jgi:hypothetical protein
MRTRPSATGGNGGSSNFNYGGDGGSATAQATGIAGQQSTISAFAIGGNGGTSFSYGFVGNGGAAILSSTSFGQAAVFGSSTTGGPVTVSGTAIGGNGGDGIGGGNGASVSLLSNGSLNDAIGGATSGTLHLTQTAIGGNGGNGYYYNWPLGDGGNASSVLIGTNPYGSSSYNLSTYATGGNGGTGGSATAITQATSSVDGSSVNASSLAKGGGAESNYINNPVVGGDAVSNSTATNNGTGGVANANAAASGGAGYYIFRPGSAYATANATAPNSGAAYANSIATTITNIVPNSAIRAEAESNAIGSSGQAKATAQSSGFDFSNPFGGAVSVQSMATSPVSAGSSASAIAQVGNGISLPNSNSIQAGQSFSVVDSTSFFPLFGGSGSMGAVYGGSGAPLIYQQSAEFTYDFLSYGFVIGFGGTQSLGKGFDSAQFQITLNGISDSVSFNDLVSAQLFFAPGFQKFSVKQPGPVDVQLTLTETLSAGEGFSFAYNFNATPLPTSWAMLLAGLACLGFVAYHRKKNMPSLIAA